MHGCKHYKKANGFGECRIATHLSGVKADKVEARPDACAACKECGDDPSNPNHVVASLVISHVIKHAPEKQLEIVKKYGPKTKKKPSVVSQAVTYSQSVAKWVSHGRPERSDEEVLKILDTCSKCKHFSIRKISDGTPVGQCLKCGCSMSVSGGATNKARMATESCPIGKWG